MTLRRDLDPAKKKCDLGGSDPACLICSLLTHGFLPQEAERVAEEKKEAAKAKAKAKKKK